jgi:isoprenylcysteine carboxyl methyltransferase (ICMT) family protein YpbQ
VKERICIELIMHAFVFVWAFSPLVMVVVLTHIHRENERESSRENVVG